MHALATLEVRNDLFPPSARPPSSYANLGYE